MRIAGAIADIAGQYTGEIELVNKANNNRARGNNVLKLLTLGVYNNTMISIEVVGENSEQTAHDIINVLSQSNLN